MARTLGRLVIQIGASTSLFERELQSAGKAVKTWGNGVTRNVNRTVARIDDRMSKLAKSIDRGFSDLGGSVNRAVNNIKIIGPALKVAGVAAGAFVAAFAAIGGIASLFTRLTEEVDLFAKTADRLGVSTQFLKGIELGATQAGINFNQLNDNLRQFTTNLFSATAGSGRFSETIEKLGFDLDELIQTDADERLKLVAQSISEIDDASERASTAVALFGESGRDLVTLFAGGAAGLEGFVTQAERLGIAFDRQTLANIENARDAIGEIGLIVESVSLRFLAAFAPLFETLADFWIQAGLTSEGVQGAMDAMANGVAFSIHVVDNTVALGFRVWFELKAVVLDAAAAITNAWAAVADALAQTFNNIISNLNRMISVVALGVRQLVNSVATAIDALPGVDAPGRANFAIPQIPNVGFSGAGARIAAQNFSGGADLARGIAGGFGPDFNQTFQARRLRVPAPPTRSRGVLPPPPPPDGGGGGRSGGGRTRAGGGAAGADTGKIDVDGKKRQQAEQLGKAFVKLQEDIEKLGRSFDRTLESTELNNEVERERLRLLQAGETDIDRRVNQFKDMRDAENQLAEAQAELDALLADNAIAASAAAVAQMELTQGYEDYVAAIEESFALDRQQERLQTINTLNEDLNNRLNDLLETEQKILGIRTEATAVETLLMELKQLDVELTDKQTTALVKQATVLDLTAERIGNLEQQYNLLNETSSIIQTNTAQLFQGLLTGTETVGSAFNKFFDNLFSQLLQLSINTLFQSIFGGGIGGGLFGGGGLLGGLFGFQEGGTVPQTGPYLLHAGERVLNPREARGGMGGGDIIINNNMAGASVTARRTQGGGAEIDIQEAVRQSREAVRNDFVRSIATGYGDYANAVQSSFQVTRRL